MKHLLLKSLALFFIFSLAEVHAQPSLKTLKNKLTHDNSLTIPLLISNTPVNHIEPQISVMTINKAMDLYQNKLIQKQNLHSPEYWQIERAEGYQSRLAIEILAQSFIELEAELRSYFFKNRGQHYFIRFYNRESSVYGEQLSIFKPWQSDFAMVVYFKFLYR